MPKCVLRVVGATNKVSLFLEGSSLTPISVYYKGNPGFPKSRGPVKESGFNIALSTVGSDSIELRVRDVLAFFKKSRNELDRLREFKFKHIEIDFGLYDASTAEKPWPSYRLPRRIVEAVGALGFEIVLSFYGPP